MCLEPCVRTLPSLTSSSDLSTVGSEITQVVEAGRSKWLLLVHDKRDSSTVPFDAIIAATPKELMKARGAGGIYDTVHCSLALLARP